MRLFTLLSVQYLRRHAARYLLLASGVAIGTAVFLAMYAATGTLSASFSDTVNNVAGQAHIQVSAGDPGVPEAVLEQVQALEIVQSAVPFIEAFVETRSRAGLLVLGVDLTGDASIRSYGRGSDKRIIAGIDPLTFIAQPDSLLISAEFAQRQHLQVGTRVPIRTATGSKNFVVRGIVREGLASSINTNVAIMDVYAAQAAFGRGERFDRIDVRLKPQIPIEEARSRIRSALGNGFSVERPSERSAELDNLLSSYSLLQNAISLFALLLGMAMISSAFRLSVAQRRVEIGILRALGATRGQIGRLFLLEGAATGFLGAVLGSMLGIGLSAVMLRYLGEILRPVLPAASSVFQQYPDFSLVTAAIVIGTLASILAAVGPAQEAASLSPHEAMRSVLPPVRALPRFRWAIAGVIAMAASATLPANSSSGLYLRVALLVGGVIGCVPWLTLTVLHIARPLLARIQPPGGSIAADSLTRSPGRTTVTIIVLTLAFTQVLVVSGVSQSAHAALADWAHRQLDQDLLVSSSPNLVNRSLQFPHTMAERLRSVPGVQDVEAVRQARIRQNDRSLLMISVDWSRTCQTARAVISGGSWPSMCGAVRTGKAIIVSENLSILSGLQAGSVVQFDTPGRPLKLPIAGVVRDFQDPRGVVYIASSVYQQFWRDDRWDKFRVYIQSNANPEHVRETILNQIGSDTPLTVLTRREVEQFIFNPVGRQVKASHAQLSLGALIALLALANLLALSVVERRSTLATFRVLGAHKKELRRTLMIEASLVAGLSVVAGAIAAAVGLRVVLDAAYSVIAGVRLEFIYPVPLLLWCLPVALGAAMLASVWPAESAFRSSLRESLAYE